VCSVRPKTRKEIARVLGKPENTITSPLKTAVESGLLQTDDPSLRAGASYWLTDGQRMELEAASADEHVPGVLARDQRLLIVIGGEPDELMEALCDEGLPGLIPWIVRTEGAGEMIVAVDTDAGDLAIDRISRRLRERGAAVRRLVIGDVIPQKTIQLHVASNQEIGATKMGA
jgi:hypothetical protein